MSNCVSKIQKSSLTLLFGVTFYHSCFDLTASADHLGQKGIIQLLDCFLICTDKSEKFSVTDKTGFQDFTHSTGKFFLGKCI